MLRSGWQLRTVKSKIAPGSPIVSNLMMPIRNTQVGGQLCPLFTSVL
jgi:hypothetical protein